MSSRRGVQRPKVCNCRQTHFWEKIKTKIEKVKFAHLSNDTRPKVGLLEKRFQKWAFRLDETRGFQKWAFRLDETLRKYRFAIICIVLRRRSWWKKKSKKVKSNKTYVFYCSRCKSEHFSWEGCKKKSRPPNHNNKRPRLRIDCFTEAKWRVAFKSDDSYTKREVATVQGAQQ